MVKKILALMFVLAVAVLLAGCKAPADETQAAVQEPATETADSDVQDVESDLNEIENLEEDLNLDELDSLEKELDEVDW